MEEVLRYFKALLAQCQSGVNEYNTVAHNPTEIPTQYLQYARRDCHPYTNQVGTPIVTSLCGFSSVSNLGFTPHTARYVYD
jgi:hypothetical protein